MLPDRARIYRHCGVGKVGQLFVLRQNLRETTKKESVFWGIWLRMVMNVSKSKEKMGLREKVLTYNLHQVRLRS